MGFFLGLDLSTTAAKAILINLQGEVVSSHSEPLSASQPRPLWSEQEPLDWWRRMSHSIQQVLAVSAVQDVEAIGLTGQMHGLVLLDSASDVIRPAILWNDQRTGEQCQIIRERVGARRLIELTGNDALTGFSAPKVLWVHEHEPAAYARVAHILLPKDYIRYRLTGEFATDRADASGTLLLDVAARDWSLEVLEMLDIPRAWLPTTFEGHEVTGYVSQAASEQTGLAVGTPVVAGGGDQSAQAVGVGALTPDVLAITVGTSGVVFAPVDSYTYEPEGRLHAFCHAVPGKWHLMGVMLSAAGSLRWYRDSLAPGESFDQLIQEVASTPAGSEGLVFLPYLTGERTPYPDPLARGGFIGLTIKHQRAHLTRAILEGVCFGLRDILDLMRARGIEPARVISSGGGMRSGLWRQILADILQVEMTTVNSKEGAAFGAALLAAVGVGAFPNIASACSATIREIGSVEPGPDTLVYQRIYPLYRQLYPLLSEEFHELSSLSITEANDG